MDRLRSFFASLNISRLPGWWFFAAVTVTAAFFFIPTDGKLLVYKLALVSTAIILAFLLNRGLHYYAHIDDHVGQLRRRLQYTNEDNPREKAAAVIAQAMFASTLIIARVLLVVAVIVGVTMGL